MSAERFSPSISHFPETQEDPKESLGSVLGRVAPESIVPVASVEEAGSSMRNDADRAALEEVRERLGRMASVIDPVTPSVPVFSPKQELEKIHDIPKSDSKEPEERKKAREERKKALMEFKAQLLAQQEAQAAYRVEAEKILESSPDTPKEKMLELLDNSASEHFSPENKALAGEILDRYYEARKKVLDKRTEFPDDRELIASLTGYDLQDVANFEVKVGPMSIDIYADRADVQTLFNRGRKHPLPPPVGGFTDTDVNGVNYSVINRSAESFELTRAHEQQHQVNRLFGETFDRKTQDVEDRRLLDLYKAAHDPEEKKTILEAVFTSQRKHAYDLLKDELFAIYSEKLPRENVTDLFKPGSIYTYYDYLKSARELNSKDPVWKETSDRMLVAEYGRVMETAATVIKDLSTVYSPEEVIAMLSEVPLEDWSKRAARIYQEKLKDSEIHASEVKDIKEKLKEHFGDHIEHKEGEDHGEHHKDDKHDHKHDHSHDSHGHAKKLNAWQKAGLVAGAGLGIGLFGKFLLNDIFWWNLIKSLWTEGLAWFKKSTGGLLGGGGSGGGKKPAKASGGGDHGGGHH